MRTYENMKYGDLLCFIETSFIVGIHKHTYNKPETQKTSKKVERFANFLLKPTIPCKVPAITKSDLYSKFNCFTFFSHKSLLISAQINIQLRIRLTVFPNRE